MSLMLKLFLTTLLISANLLATTDAEVTDFLKKSFTKNPNITKLDINVIEKRPVQELKGWTAYMIEITGTLKQGDQERTATQHMTWFEKDGIITDSLIDIKTGKKLADSLAPLFRDSYYTKANLISGMPDAEHKVALFSDPLCPFCIRLIPDVINHMAKFPEKYAIYYYHLPLEQLHPAAVPLTKAAIAMEQQGRKLDINKLYSVGINSREEDTNKILAAYNHKMNTKIAPEDINTTAVEAHFAHDRKIARSLMVSGTPTIFIDGEKVSTRALVEGKKNKFSPKKLDEYLKAK